MLLNEIHLEARLTPRLQVWESINNCIFLTTWVAFSVTYSWKFPNWLTLNDDCSLKQAKEQTLFQHRLEVRWEKKWRRPEISTVLAVNSNSHPEPSLEHTRPSEGFSLARLHPLCLLLTSRDLKKDLQRAIPNTVSNWLCNLEQDT